MYILYICTVTMIKDNFNFNKPKLLAFLMCNVKYKKDHKRGSYINFKILKLKVNIMLAFLMVTIAVAANLQKN